MRVASAEARKTGGRSEIADLFLLAYCTTETIPVIIAAGRRQSRILTPRVWTMPPIFPNQRRSRSVAGTIKESPVFLPDASDEHYV